MNWENLLLTYNTAAKKAIKIAETSGSESKLQIGLEPILQELLYQQGIRYNPAVNESLTKLSLSQMSSERPDSLFGHVVLDYKESGLLDRPQELIKAKTQIERYLNEVTGGGPLFNPGESYKWAGILWDGYHLTFCHAVDLEWSWSRLHDTSEASLLSLVQIYRSLGRLPLTSSLLTKYFGKESEVAKATLLVMCSHLSKPKHRTNLLFREWKRLFQQVSTYGLSQLPSLREWSKRNGIATNDASQILFAMHTYYSLVVKLLTAELLGATQTSRESSIVEVIANAPDDTILYRELVKVENGDFFRKYRVNNFLEGDFFSWYTNEESAHLAKSIRAIAHTFQEFEPATAKLKPEIVKDLLKEFYSSLVDEQIRHDLGEYYTPDWLAGYLLDQVGYDGEPNKVIVDPACGSGTFIVECIKRLRQKCAILGYSPLKTLQTVLYSVRGLDLNPLAVISARANYILAIADLVFSLGHDVEIPIYLADSINVPIEKPEGLLEYSLDTEVGDVKFTIPVNLVKEQALGKILLKCEDFINQNRSSDQFYESLTKDSSISHLLDKTAKDSLTGFYKAIQALNNRKPPWDSIWCRIVKNNFSPRGFENVDYIIGNPPWVRWSRLPETYRKRVKRFCDYYGLVSGRSYTGGIESDISTVLTFSVVDHWLKPGGRIGFLITSTVFKSSSATGFRIGRLPDSKGIRIDQIEDLSNIQPFPDAANATSIYIATKVEDAAQAIFSQVPCRIWSAKESARITPSMSIGEVQGKVVFDDGEACPVGKFGSPLFMGRKADYDEASSLKGESKKYLLQAHRGTVTDLSRVYWVKVERYSPETNRALIRTLTKEELSGARMVESTEGAWIEADVLFPLPRGRDVGRYCIKSEGWYQIIPNRHYAKFANEEEFAETFPATFSYLMNYADLLSERSTYKRYQKRMGLPIYSIYCVGDYSFSPYKVAWLEQQDPRNFRATVVTEDASTRLPNKVIVPDHKLYYVVIDSLKEAHYLCAFLNSHPVRTWLGGFLIGKQIGTSIFEFTRVPIYDAQDNDHRELAYISRIAHEKRNGTRNTAFLSDKLEHEIQMLVRKISQKT
jgi:hypothetical protein